MLMDYVIIMILKTKLPKLQNSCINKATTSINILHAKYDV